MMMPSIFGESLFDDFFDTVSKPIKAFRGAPIPQVMRTDVKESDKGFTLDIDLPGYKKEDISAELKDGYLTVSAKTNEEHEEKEEDGTYIRRERTFGSCSRSFYVGENIKAEDVKAKFENGILNIVLPSKEQKSIETKQTVTID